jgi:uncharacterized protein
MKKIEVSCPHCKKKFDYYSSEFRPFCSDRCRLLDLGQWLSESYAVEAKQLTEEELLTLEELHEKNKDAEDH